MAMVQAFSYNFSTVENPLSDGGLFAAINNGDFTGATLKTIAGNLCEPAVSTTAGTGMFKGTIAAPGGVLPNDQYCEVTLTTWTGIASDNFYLVVRGAGPTIQQYYGISVNGLASGNYTLFANNGSNHTLVASGNLGATATQGDVWRLSVTGNVITISQNGTTRVTFTDTNNFVPSGGYAGFGLNAVVITAVQSGLFAFGANQCTTPTFSPVAGNYSGTQTVTITGDSGSTIYYTTDGSTPTESSASIASGATISVASSSFIRAITSKTNFLDSAVGSAGYVINGVPLTINVSWISGIHQNSSVSSGGGTDDTSTIQAVLTALSPLVLVQDGASLITGLNVGSNTTIKCNNATQGFYLANASNREIIRNVNRSKTTITDTNITLDGGYYNGNSANQSGSGSSGVQFQADNTPITGIAFYGISNLTIKNLEVHNSKCWNSMAANYNNVTVNNCTFSQSNVTSNLSTDGVDLRGPGSNATLSNLIITSGDDGIALNSRAYTTIGPYIGGGNIINTVISTVNFNTSWAGIDLVSDGTFAVEDVYISAISGAVQNYALYLNRDLFTTPVGVDGTFKNVYISGSTCTQSGTPFGAPIPPGLWAIDGIVNDIQFSNIVSSQILSLPTVFGQAVSLILNGVQRGSITGIASLTTTQSGFMQGDIATLGASVNNLSKAFPANVTAGNVLVVFSFGFLAGGATITSIQDTVGTALTWTPRGTFTDGATGHVAEVWTAIASAYEAHTVKVNYSGTMTALGLEVAEYGASAVDASSALSLSAALTTITCPSVTVPGGHTDSVLGIGTGSGTTAAVAPSILRQFVGANLSLLEDSVQGAGSYTPSWTQGSAASYNMSMALLNNPAQTKYSIMGYVGLAGVTVSCSGGSAVSDAYGNFVISGLANGSYTLTPSKTGYAFSPASVNETISSADINGVEFTATPQGGAVGPSSGLQSVQFFGRLPNGKIAAVAVDTHGNLAVSGGTGGAINTVDVLGNGQATPAMLYGATPSGKVVAVAVDANGNLCATVGAGGGNPNTTVDVSAYTQPTPVQVIGREPSSGTLYAVPLSGSNALYDSVNPGSTAASSLAAPLAKPRKVILCGRAPNGQIVAVALDSSGRLCIAGSGSSGAVNTVDVYKNGTPIAIQIFGVNASGSLAAVPLDANGNLTLS